MTDRVVALTGASGFLGTAVLRRLAAMPGVRVIAVSRSRPALEAASVRWVEADLRDLTAAHWGAAGGERVDAVIHVGAFIPKNAADQDRCDEIYAANIAGTHALLLSLVRPPRRLVFCSSVDVYTPGAFVGPVTESAPVAPEGLYGASKLFGEALARAYAKRAGFENVAVRLGHIYGPGEGRYVKLIPETIRRVLAGQPPRIAGDGRERRDYLYVDDAAQAIIRAMSAPLDAAPTINIASGESHEVREVAALIAAQAGYEGPVEHLPATTALRSTAFDTSLMRRVLGRWTLTTLEDGLRREIAWFRENA